MIDPVMRDLNRYLDQLDYEEFKDGWIQDWIDDRKLESSILIVKVGVPFQCFGCDKKMSMGAEVFCDPINREVSCEHCFENSMGSYAEQAFDERNEA